MKNDPKGYGSGAGQALYRRARTLIPGGTQLLSKRPELFLPEQWPSYYERAKGARVWDLDGNSYLDFTHCAVGTCTLGYADDEVNAAVAKKIQAGSMGTLNCPEEVELAEVLIDLHQWADMIRYARTGGEALAIAARVTRAATGRTRIAVCGYHGWTDWYLAANIADGSNLDEHLLPGLSPVGVPPALEGSVIPFRYNRIDELETIVAEHGNDLAAVFMEPQRNEPPTDGFVEKVRDATMACGAVLLFDEVTSAWRMNTGGIHLTMGITPDMAVFAKGMSNGYPMAAVIGTRAVMEAAQDTFISSTYWTEGIGPVAAIATIGKHRRENAADHLIRIGNRVRAGWRDAARSVNLGLNVHGIPPLSGFAFEGEGDAVMTTLFSQEMLARGFLAAPAFYPMLAHTDEHVDLYLDALAEVFALLAQADKSGNVDRRLNGPVKHNGFQRLI